jgi:hypothetical protein
MLLSQVLDDLAVDLNDAEEGHAFQTWTRGQLLAYLNEALCNAFSLNPSLFTTTVVIQLQAGGDQQPCDCTILHNIIGQTDAQGNMLDGYLPRRSNAATYAWSKPGCPATSGGPFRLTGYNFDPLENGGFSVTPPVPPGAKVYVKARCATIPDAFTSADLDAPCCGSSESAMDCRMITAAKQWVLFRAHMVDEQSLSSLNTAMIHLKLYFQLLNVQFSRQLGAQIGALSSPAAASLIPAVSSAKVSV